MLNLQTNISYQRKWGGPKYSLQTMDRFLRIMRNKEVIHAQTVDHETDWGLKKLKDILANIDEYVAFIEEHRPFKELWFDCDEWARHTKIYIHKTYVKPNGEYSTSNYRFEDYPGEMSYYAAERHTEKYLMFIHNVNSKKELENTLYKEEKILKFENAHDLINHVNETRKQLRELQKNQKK